MVVTTGAAEGVLGTALLGRALGGDGAPLDGRRAPRGRSVPIAAPAPPPGDRVPVREPVWTGVRAIDGPLTIGRGARLGLFGAPGAGKSTLLGAVASAGAADVAVVGLVGERGREAERWLAALDRRTSLICATSDRPAAERLRAAELAFAQADALRARGLHVLLVVDSLARIAAAARDLAISAGEPVGRAGFPPSVVATQARLLERAGPTRAGSVTLIATVLSEGPLEADPIADAARAALDGHIVLDPRLAGAGWFPAIGLAASASRTLPDVAAPAHRRDAARLRSAVAALDASRDARAVGLPVVDPAVLAAVAAEAAIAGFLQQGPEPSPPDATLTALAEIADRLNDGHLR